MKPKKAEEGSQGCIFGRPEKHIPQTPSWPPQSAMAIVGGQNMDFRWYDGGLKFGKQDIDFFWGGGGE